MRSSQPTLPPSRTSQPVQCGNQEDPGSNTATRSPKSCHPVSAYSLKCSAKYRYTCSALRRRRSRARPRPGAESAVHAATAWPDMAPSSTRRSARTPAPTGSHTPDDIAAAAARRTRTHRQPRPDQRSRSGDQTQALILSFMVWPRTCFTSVWGLPRSGHVGTAFRRCCAPSQIHRSAGRP